MSWVYFRDKLCPVDSVQLSLSNRAYRYADGVFESIRLYNGVPVFWSKHYERLSYSLKVYGIDFRMTQDELKSVISATIAKNELRTHGMLRITVYRDGAGKYTPETNTGVLVVEAIPTAQSLYPMPVVRKKAKIYNEFKLPSNALGSFKGLNKTLHVLAAVSAKKEQCDEALLLNHQGVIGEALSSSVFCYTGSELITPPLSDGGLDGTLRKVIIQHQDFLEVKVIEQSVHPNEIMNFEEVWTTNAGSGISCITQLGEYTYQDLKANETQAKLEALAVNSCSDFLETQT
ncbi:MAG: branched-chain-amino-acid transaminase [Salibacteraceae bacterium]